MIALWSHFQLVLHKKTIQVLCRQALLCQGIDLEVQSAEKHLRDRKSLGELLADGDQNRVASVLGTLRIPEEKRSAQQCTELFRRRKKLQLCNSWLIAGRGKECIPWLGLTLYFNKQFRRKKNGFLLAGEKPPLRC